ncbi:hypothetical protein SAMN06297229_0018 [Pseudidiomarina planktonica]|uniref:Uncharacterized protein n=1 Tax=Pseudidiomarina planktonica TaxID=1323738 RepID=A0A1Y6E521_9GAMM|nr:hypothetical protein [Pseudidiomarina planktonica]RUO66467.1 hypothetical protein CWI77_08635 [Pseudidiomarina planktonica]SMQ57874.1 hypothetical protein SAMN06297229_0018 [Pseudidiomarina planktonica]
MKNLYSGIALSLLILNGCASGVSVKHPPEQKISRNSDRAASTVEGGKSAYDFADRDIAVPAYFDTQGLELCTFDGRNEAAGCPLKKPLIRVYFDGNDYQGADAEMAKRAGLDNQKLLLMFENQVAGVNRFQVVTQDETTVNAELAKQIEQQGAAAVAEQRAQRGIAQPEFVLKLDTLKTADRFYAEYNGVMQYALEITSSVIDPYTMVKLPQPNIGKIRVRGDDVWDKNDLVFVEVSGRYYSGYQYDDPQSVQSVFNDMASRGFDILISRLLSEMPATGQVLGVRGDQITLDRGQNAGVLPNETMIIFEYEAGFVEPIGVAEVNPSSTSANGRIVRWKQSQRAREVRSAANNAIYRPASERRLFAVSVGAPESYLDSRL